MGESTFVKDFLIPQDGVVKKIQIRDASEIFLVQVVEDFQSLLRVVSRRDQRVIHGQKFRELHVQARLILVMGDANVLLEVGTIEASRMTYGDTWKFDFCDLIIFRSGDYRSLPEVDLDGMQQGICYSAVQQEEYRGPEEGLASGLGASDFLEAAEMDSPEYRSKEACFSGV